MQPYPPPPVAGAVVGAARPRFRSLRGLAIALLVLFIVLACTYALLAAFLGARIALVGRIMNGERVTFAEANDADDAVTGAVGLVVLVVVAVAVLFIVWLWRAYRNVDTFGVGPRRYGQGWAIGAWFLPGRQPVHPEADRERQLAGRGRTSARQSALGQAADRRRAHGVVDHLPGVGHRSACRGGNHRRRKPREPAQLGLGGHRRLRGRRRVHASWGSSPCGRSPLASTSVPAPDARRHSAGVSERFGVTTNARA